MLAYSREKMIQHLSEVSSLVDLYQQHDSAFITKSVAWLVEVETTLLQLRLPLVSIIATGRARIVAAVDGHREPQLGSEKLSARKAAMALTSLVLGQAQELLHQSVVDIDKKFDVWRDKMAQFLAVATVKKPIPLPITEPRDVWLKNVWAGFDLKDETQSMYCYINVVTQPSDRMYLLGELIDNSLIGQST